MKRFISEDDIERACIEVCTDNLGYKTFNCMNQDHLNRKSEREVLYEYRVKRCRLATDMPTTLETFGNTFGIGEHKRDTYGKRFIEVIKQYAPAEVELPFKENSVIPVNGIGRLVMDL